MGLHQDFKFEYEKRSDVERFLEDFSDSFMVDNHDGLFVISGEAGAAFEFDANIEDFGLRSNRSGEYFEFLGVFLERITGEFGAVLVEDV